MKNFITSKVFENCLIDKPKDPFKSTVFIFEQQLFLRKKNENFFYLKKI